ncbi:MAG: hypothetical protein R2694_10945 [Ilumatobacteraceae bacterium]|nr:hypothetical protein [Acidimicrobiaceae bacterium]MCO5330190.1 hypothetical protein [Ilumatobacteraceae bacterium]
MARPTSLRSFLSPVAYLRRGAVYKGVLGGRRGWMAVGAVLWTPKLLKKAFGKNEEIVATEKLKPGQFVRLEAIPPTTRRQRKAAKRARTAA